MSVKSFALKSVRFLLDFITDALFRLIYFGQAEKVLPVTDSLLLEPASLLVKKIIKQQVKSVDIVEAYILRIKEVQPVLNAITDNRFTEALKDAKNVDELIRSRKYSEYELEEKFPFLGIPFTVKESIGVKDMLNTAGLYTNKGNRALEDADSVALIRKAGGIPLAVTNVSELCIAWETNNKIYGRTLNPYNTKRIVGGSSGGEAALLASGGSLIGIGSDIGGSIRMPAFFTGIFGHKTSKHIISIKGMVPKCDGLFEDYLSVGPLCRYAIDLLPMLKVLSDGNSKLTLNENVDISKLKIYYMEDDGGNPLATPVSSELKFAQRKVLKYFEERYDIKPRRLNLKQMKWSLSIRNQNIAQIPAPRFASVMMQNKREANIVLELFKWILGKSDFTFPSIVFAFLEKYNRRNVNRGDKKFVVMANDLRNEFQNILCDDGIFFYPSHPETAIFHNQSFFKFYNSTYTNIFNILGLPVTQCPLGLSSEGLPLGIQIVGGLNKDHITISVATELEKVFGGWKNPNL